MDPITLASVGSIAITEGIKFLYGQASELLKHMREHKEAEAKAAASAVEPAPVVLPAQAFEGQLKNPVIHYVQLHKVQGALYDARKALADYADGLVDVDPKDPQMVASVDVLRQLVEAVYQQRITFKGEQREPSGPVVEGSIDVERILGDAVAVEARWVKTGKVTGRVQAKEVAQGAHVTGVKVDTVGE